MNELTIVGLGALGLWAAGKYRAFKSTEFGIGLPRNFRYSPPTNVTFDLPISAFNGSRTALNVGAVDLRVFAEGQYLGRAFSAAQQRIQPAGQSVITTQVVLNLIDMAAAIPGFLGGVKDQAIGLRFTGNINVEGFYANVDIPYNFNIPKFK